MSHKKLIAFSDDKVIARSRVPGSFIAVNTFLSHHIGTGHILGGTWTDGSCDALQLEANRCPASRLAGMIHSVSG